MTQTRSRRRLRVAAARRPRRRRPVTSDLGRGTASSPQGQTSGGLTTEALLGFDSLGPDPDEESFRRLGEMRARRDLEPRSQQQMLRICHWLYDADPLAGWIVDQRVDLVIGGDELGYSIEIDPHRLALEDDPDRVEALAGDIRLVLDRFWEHPAHNLRYRADEYLTSLMVSGELCLVVAGVNDLDGVPELDFIDPAQIAAVKPLAQSVLVPGAVVLTPKTPGDPPRSLAVVQYQPGLGRLDGQCFFFRNSRLANSLRGRSELLRQADWIDSLNQFLWARVDRAVILNNVMYDVTLEGMNEVLLKKRARDIRKNPPTKPLSIRVHNEKEKWNVVVPELQGSDAAEEVRMVRNHIIGSKSMPESWFASGGEVTRTTAGEQNDVALQTLKAWRKRTRYLFSQLLAYAYDQIQAKQPVKFPARVTGAVKLTVDLPPLAERDISRLGGVVQNLEAALDSAVLNERISRSTARKVFLHVVDHLGVSVDPDAEDHQITIERAKAEEETMATANRRALAAATRALGDIEDA